MDKCNNRIAVVCFVPRNHRPPEKIYNGFSVMDVNDGHILFAQALILNSILQQLINFIVKDVKRRVDLQLVLSPCPLPKHPFLVRLTVAHCLVHPPPRKSERTHANIDYTSLNLGDTNNILPDQHAYNAFFEGEAPRKFGPDRFKRMRGDQLTKEWGEDTGCKEPVVIPKEHKQG